MEAIESSRSSCSSSTKDDEAEAMELLDDYWFFQNLLNKKNRMFRSSSDPYPSNNMDQVFAQIQSESNGNRVGVEENGSIYQNLQRTPSLPVTIGRENRVEEKEVINRPNRLSRQSSLLSSNVLPPIRAAKTTTTISPGIPKHLTRRESLSDSRVKEGKPRAHRTKDLSRSFSQNLTKSLNQLEIEDGKRYPYRQKEMMHRSLSQNKISKSPTELESEEVQGFKDLGFDFDKLDLNPCVADIIPGLQSKKLDTWHEDKVRRPYLSEAWLVHKPTPSIPEWIDPGSVGDMKKHLKYWARAVASNMRQEC